MKKPDIFTFENYFDYFQSVYEMNKEVNPNFSYQYFADKLGLSKTLVYDTLKSKKKLSVKNIMNFIEVLKLDNIESEYLIYLFLETQTNSKGADYFKSKRKKTFSTDPISANGEKVNLDDAEFFLVVSILRCKTFLPSAKDLVKSIEPFCKITEQKVQGIYDTLLEKKLMNVKDNGELSFSESNFFSHNNINTFDQFSAHFDSCSQNFIKLYQEEGSEGKLSPCVFDHMYLDLTKEQAKQLDKELLFLRNKYMSDKRSDKGKIKGVYQLDLRLFPCYKLD